MTTEAQKTLFAFEMEETFGGWKPVDSDDYEKILDELNENSSDQESVEDNANYSDITIYTFSDGSVVEEHTNKNASKVFDHRM